MQHFHSKTPEQTLRAFNTSLSGLREGEARQRLSQYGANQLPHPPRRHPVLRFLAHFHNILIYVLLGAALITLMLGHIADTLVIGIVVIINAVIGFLQEGKAEKAMDAIRHMLAQRAAVIRDGKRQTVMGEVLVPGDIVLLEAGDKIPADLRLLNTYSLQVQEAVLTGESMPVDKDPTAVAEHTTLGDCTCMGFSGTTVTTGQGIGVVVATGVQTEIGRISGLLSEVQPLNTPLLTQMSIFAKGLTLAILTIAAGMFLFGYLIQTQDFTTIFMTVVGLSVAAIPEGLPAVLTITMAVGVQTMARHNAIVRRLPAIETLGSVSVICSDKTGTLTRNEMNVVSLISRDIQFEINGIGYEPIGEIRTQDKLVTAAEHPILLELARTAALCNDAELSHQENIWTGHGDPMEVALLAMAGKIGGDHFRSRREWTRTDVIPFDTRHKYMATLNHNHENNAFIFVKGAPETLLALCSLERGTHASAQAQLLDRDFWLQQAHQIAAQGQRVLAFAIKPVPPEHTVLEHHDMADALIFLGLAGLIDPPRPEAITAIAECHHAGIDVKMITGDHAATAVAIGKQLGLTNYRTVLTGAELDQLDDAALNHIVCDTGIFARTSPEHKLRLVMALQARGMTVAMTGDGVNDAPALKRAGVGIAMGKNGSEAAKEAAEIVLTDDHFATIVAAVREGRTVYDNIKKVISWTLPTNAGEAMTIIVAVLLGISLPITPIQILWVNMITAVTLGIALAFEPTETNTMRRQPRNRNESLLSRELVWQIVLVACLFLAGVFGVYQYAMIRGYSEDLARTIAMNTLVVLEIFHLFFIRNMYGTSLTWKAIRGTRVIWAAILAVTLGQFAITYVPWLQSVFQTESVPWQDGLLIVAIGVTVFSLTEIEKQIRLKRRRRQDASTRSSPHNSRPDASMGKGKQIKPKDKEESR
ncbi:cation-transporting P-type ATPase [Photobacterium sp. MCCC 1A19761]|uniref:cation-translocating P-type ATPase n=1 Tax=Photobacterium sp. MCCC 1A19761 TaxID=3115000 RepID=UPI00307EEC48